MSLIKTKSDYSAQSQTIQRANQNSMQNVSVVKHGKTREIGTSFANQLRRVVKQTKKMKNVFENHSQ